jgi:DUF1680 family protein
MTVVRLNDEFWEPRRRINRTITLPSQYRWLEETGRLRNFQRAAGEVGGEFQGRFFNDSDVYKWLEAASFALAGLAANEGERGRELEQLVDGVIAEIVAAQSPDGYLNTYFTFEREAERWTDLTTKHEMYCAGHFIQAAIAHHRATGRRSALDVAVRLANHICATFGPTARAGTDGHEEIEMAMVELARETGDRRYLDQAGFLLDQRGRAVSGRPVISGSPYHQDHLPVREQREIVGHAVRATYLACGVADVAAETGDAGLRDALDALWQSAFTRKAYLPGGLGAHWAGEAVGADYQLPSERAYTETCAAIGGFMWNWRMLGLAGPSAGGVANVARFADWMEIALYNGILAGLSLDGTEYFYQNPLADDGHHRRQPWFGTACCPPNIARLLLALPGYLYGTSAEGLWVHHYAAGEARIGLGESPTGNTAVARGLVPRSGVAPSDNPGSNGRTGAVALRVETNYPWDGSIRLRIEEAPEAPWSLFLRVPGWCEQPCLTVNGAPAAAEFQPGSYAELRREWRPGDEVALDLPMPVRRVVAHPRIAATTGRVALMRGPLVYCLEGVDHPGVDLRDVVVRADTQFRTERRPALLGGIVTILGEAQGASPAAWDGQLYASASRRPQPERRTVPLTAVPYYAWANRAPGQMQVWLRAET